MKKVISVIFIMIGMVFINIIYHSNSVALAGEPSGYSPRTYQKGGHNIKVSTKGMTDLQKELLVYALRVAKKDGHLYPEVLQGILWQESRVGAVRNYKVAGQEFGLREMKRYYGVGQIKIAAARDVLKRWPELGIFKTNEELVAHLILDDKFNIRVASKYLIIVGYRKNKSFRGKAFQITAYNRGMGPAYKGGNGANDTWHYTVAVNRHMKTIIKKFNKNNGRSNKTVIAQAGKF